MEDSALKASETDLEGESANYKKMEIHMEFHLPILLAILFDEDNE